MSAMLATSSASLRALQVDIKPSLPSVTVFMTIRHVPLPEVLPAVRLRSRHPCTVAMMLTGVMQICPASRPFDWKLEKYVTDRHVAHVMRTISCGQWSRNHQAEVLVFIGQVLPRRT